MHIFHQAVNDKDINFELKKSSIGLATSVVATGVLGAIGAKQYGPTGSLLGVCLSSAIGRLTKCSIDNS